MCTVDRDVDGDDPTENLGGVDGCDGGLARRLRRHLDKGEARVLAIGSRWQVHVEHVDVRLKR